MHSTVSPRQLARAIGASESSVKRWCDQGMLPSVKTAGGHRRLSLAGVMAFLEKRGHSLVRPEQIGLPAGLAGGRPGVCDQARHAFKAALQAGELSVCQRYVAELRLAGKSTAWICDEWIAPSLAAIGEGWCRSSVEIYEERRGCEIVVRLLLDLLHWLPARPTQGPQAIGCTLSGDPYSLSPRMVELVLRECGWNATSLGCGLPLDAFVRALRRHRPRLAWLCVSHIPCVDDFLRAYESLWQEAEQCGTAVAVGGCALTAALRKQMNYSLYGDKLQHLVCFVNELQRGYLQNPTSGGTTACIESP